MQVIKEIGCPVRRASPLHVLAARFDRSTARGAGMHWRYMQRKWLWKAAVRGSLALKRLTDIVASALALLLLSPLFVLVSVLIKARDGGPVLFWQQRVGQWGRPFAFPKFRSMVINAEQMRARLTASNDHSGGITFKMRHDPRITWIGRITRRFSIDELPQLWCVLRGELALVGPRPAIPEEVAKYTLADRRRLDIKPGLTCTWQVSGRSILPFERQVALDVEYIQSQSFAVDLKIVLRTIPAILTGKGAY